jgi:hypothetical protein
LHTPYTSSVPCEVTTPKGLVAFSAFFAEATKIAGYISINKVAEKSANFGIYGWGSVVWLLAPVLNLGIIWKMFCLLVDGKIPEDHNGRFSMLYALASAEGLLATLQRWHILVWNLDVVTFGGPGGF